YRLRVLAVPAQLDAEARLLYLGYFQKQANQLAALQHTHILPLLSYATYQGIPCLAYQRYPMVSLSKHLAQHGSLDVQRAGFYLDQIAGALECGHQRGILHLNLSTECIFIKQDGNLVVADFGVLHILEYEGSYAPAAKYEPLFGMNEASSPAPEQVAGHAVDATADVYALGAVLYRMLTGHRVFRGKTRQEIAQQHVNVPVPPLNTWRRDLPTALDSVIARAMAKDPRQRFARPGELANAYSQVIAPSDSKRQPFVAPAAPVLAPLSKVQPAFTTERRNQTSIPRRKVLTFLVAGGSAAAAITIVSIVGIRSLQGNNAGITSTTTSGTTSTSVGRSTPAFGSGST
ncbi:MAG: serine/threonine protein kinase, partial [Ktedonobacteraceae bacterium]